MGETTRYKIKAPNSKAYAEAVEVLTHEAKVVLENPRRNTIAATKLNDSTVSKLRGMDLTVTKEVQFDID